MASTPEQRPGQRLNSPERLAPERLAEEHAAKQPQAEQPEAGQVRTDRIQIGQSQGQQRAGPASAAALSPAAPSPVVPFPDASVPVGGDVFWDVHQSVRVQKWVRRAFNERDALGICQKWGVSRLVAEVASARGVGIEEAGAFLNPSLRELMPDPSCLTDLDKAVSRLVTAVQNGEKIGVFGDYDVDGITSTALLLRYFGHLGIDAVAHLPDRLLEGYGPNEAAFESLRAQGCSLCLTVDCGAMAHGVIEAAMKDGLEIIVMDHHQMSLPPPPALATVNPNRPDDVSDLGDLSAAGVTFMVLAGLSRALRGSSLFEEKGAPPLIAWLDLVALGLVCDVMALRGFTRVLVAQGIKVLGQLDEGGAQSPFPGLAAIAAAANPSANSSASGAASAYHLGFVLGPRINAAGRVGHAKQALDLLLTRDAARASKLAAQLNHLNSERQHIEAAVLEAAIKMVEAAQKGHNRAPDLVLVAQEGWHPGVIGIVAGRLKEKYNCPAVVISLDGATGKGSGRSIPGVDLGAAIAGAVQDRVITGGGGHAMAAGLTLATTDMPRFEAYLRESLGETIGRARCGKLLYLDGQATLDAIHRPLCEEIAAAGPFGNGNPEPRFAIENVKITYADVKGGHHVACTLRDPLGRTARAICFRCVGTPLGDTLLAAGERAFHIAGRIKPDDWRGGNAAQLHIEDIAVAV